MEKIRDRNPNIEWAERHQSDRYFNPNNMLCLNWENTDNLGRSVDKDSFTTDQAGCSSARPRIIFENKVRPSHFAELGLSNYAFDDNCAKNDSVIQSWGYGKDIGNIQRPDPLANRNVFNRNVQWLYLAEKNLKYRNLSGML